MCMAISNGMLPPGSDSGISSDVDGKWLDFTSLKLDSRIGEGGDIQVVKLLPFSYRLVCLFSAIELL